MKKEAEKELKKEFEKVSKEGRLNYRVSLKADALKDLIEKICSP